MISSESTRAVASGWWILSGASTHALAKPGLHTQRCTGKRQASRRQVKLKTLKDSCFPYSLLIVIIIEGLTLLQSIPPTTANKQTQAHKKSGSMLLITMLGEFREALVEGAQAHAGAFFPNPNPQPPKQCKMAVYSLIMYLIMNFIIMRV